MSKESVAGWVGIVAVVVILFVLILRINNL